MYTKTGLGLLAAAGLTFGVIGMQNGGASPATPACTSTSAGGNAATGRANVGHRTTPTTEPNGSNHGNGGAGGTTGQGLLSVDSSGAPGGGPGTVTVPNPTGAATGGGGSGTSDTFLDLDGGTGGTASPGGQSAPPANAGVVGRSSSLARLLQLNANANTHR